MSIVEYNLVKRDDGAMGIPWWIKDGGHYPSPIDHSMVGLAYQARQVEYSLPPLKPLTKADFVKRQLAIHAVSPTMKLVDENGNPLESGSHAVPGTLVALTEEEVTTEAETWYTNFVTSHVSEAPTQAMLDRLLPVFADFLPADREMAAYVDRVRAPYQAKLEERLAVAGELLYRRGNFNGTFDQLICDALLAVKGAQIAFSPGFRWGTSLLPGQEILMEHVLDQTAITYPATTVNEMSGEMIKTVLEDVADNLFNPDPYLQQGVDMVRFGGLQYTIDPAAKMGSRISGMRLHGKPIEPGKTYKVAGWTPVAEGATGEPSWDVVARYLRDRKVVKPIRPNSPTVKGMAGNPGVA